VALVRTDVSEELSAAIIRVPRIGGLGATLAVTSSVRRLLVTVNVPSSRILVTLMVEALGFPETSVLQEPHGVTSQKTPFLHCLFRVYQNIIFFSILHTPKMFS
jgi:hypothetical protein